MKASFDGRTHLLLGNGFSISCDPIFRYDKLYDAAVAAGLSERAQKVFGRLGTNNFESVMRLLDDGHWLAKNYGLLDGDSSELLEDLEVIKNTLVTAIATSHVAHTGLVPDAKKQSALTFLEPFHFIFTSNYDLLLYWVNMCSGDRPTYGDGFRGEWEDPDAKTVVFTQHLGDDKGIFFIHGALHLFVENGAVRKHCWCRSGQKLTTSIREGLDANRFPLFVAEGTHDRKLEQIHRSGYLSYCLSKLGRVTKTLVALGLSFGESDTHIANVIAENQKIDRLCVGLFGNPDSASNQTIIAAVGKIVARRNQMLVTRQSRRPGGTLSVTYFDSASAKVWG